MATSFSGGGSRSTRKEPLTMGKQLVNIVECGVKRPNIIKSLSMGEGGSTFTCHVIISLFLIEHSLSLAQAWLF
jgi:hypothetical protein